MSEEFRQADSGDRGPPPSGNLVHAMATIGAAAGESDAQIVFERGAGLKLWDSNGREYLDAMSGLMNVTVGYGRRDLAAAAADVLESLGFAPSFYGLASRPSEELAARLAERTPVSIERFLFTVGGSDAVDSAIKLARRFHHVAGRPEKRIVVGRHQSYHGMTLGALNAMGEAAYREGFGPLDGEGFVHIAQPHPEGDRAEALSAAIEEHGADAIAAFIAEPISLPPGVLIPPEGYWERVRELCTANDILLVLDEVITGFGRTGKLFAAEHWDIKPDMLVMAKGITSGYLPLGALGISSEVWERAVRGQQFLHGFTAGGHPASCAVAQRNLEIIERDELVERSAVIGGHLKRRLGALSDELGLGPVRGIGMLTAMDVTDAEAAAAWLGTHLPRHARAVGLLIRQYGGTTMVAPSLVATEVDVNEIADRLSAAIRSVIDVAPDEVVAGLGRRDLDRAAATYEPSPRSAT